MYFPACFLFRWRSLCHRAGCILTNFHGVQCVPYRRHGRIPFRAHGSSRILVTRAKYSNFEWAASVNREKSVIKTAAISTFLLKSYYICCQKVWGRMERGKIHGCQMRSCEYTGSTVFRQLSVEVLHQPHVRVLPNWESKISTLSVFWKVFSSYIWFEYFSEPNGPEPASYTFERTVTLYGIFALPFNFQFISSLVFTTSIFDRSPAQQKCETIDHLWEQLEFYLRTRWLGRNGWLTNILGYYYHWHAFDPTKSYVSRQYRHNVLQSSGA